MFITSFKKMKLNIVLIMVVTMSLFISACSSGKVPDNIEAMRSIFSENKYIIHACGFVSDDEGTLCDYTNSREALENSLLAGNKIIEVDFHYTSDGTLVCGKAWGDLYLDGKQMTPGEAPTLSDYLQCKILEKFTVLTFDDIANYMREYTDMIVVTDTKETNIETYKMIASSYPDLTDRFVVQIYHASEYDEVKKAGFPYIIYTLYETEDSERTEEALLRAAKKPLVGFTFHIDLTEDQEFMSIMQKTNTPLFVHTVNDDEQIKKYLSEGISGIYTDRTDL
ncbi:glycerophosphodiester phosphodiesterase family protein [Butyrivibrio sp. INlla16]|uniref:glycerophosphodiester phosphodiesterase family protein n=1 Tax=Butyrivibrio sp. INlla16 TaxID=1520807 RepID=UPI0008830B1B|nr:glycerophosphodiester phosphodiesterase family protein [Butyrivibrio sp. INlla16]SDB55672.1 Glycerophosphoryl diester phosphodiesterase [Butyrivibrio sp. INlla16]